MGGRIRVVETWYDDEPASFEGFDLWVCHQRPQPVSPRGWLYFYSIHMDLTQTREALLANLHKSTAKAIRQAENQESLSCAFNTAPSEAEVAAFVALYDASPRTHGQDPMDRGRIQALHQAGLLHLSSVSDADGGVLVRHALLNHEHSSIIQMFVHVSKYLTAKDPAEARALGRANRFLFFQEFLFYKEQGYRAYDLNGWYAGVEDEKRLQINQFKEGFGGRILYGFECEEALSPRGRVYLWLRGLKQRLFQPEKMKEIRRRREKAPRLSDEGEPWAKRPPSANSEPTSL
ncbi:MAG: hypothetical protein Q8K67_05315 [Geothrix sp.]|nr:hypothetical protein [Geothrix sp.]